MVNETRLTIVSARAHDRQANALEASGYAIGKTQAWHTKRVSRQARRNGAFPALPWIHCCCCAISLSV